MRILVIADHDGQTIKAATLNTVSAAQEIAHSDGAKGAEIDLCVLGDRCDAVVESASKIKGIKTVKWLQSPDLTHPLAEVMAKAILTLAKDYTHILMPATTFGKNVLPRVAAQLDAMQISEVIKVHNTDTFDRPIYAGNAIATVQSSDPIKLLTIRSTAFPVAELGGNATVEKIAFKAPPSQSTYVALEASTSERPELTSARIVVSGGRALSSKENFVIIEKLADCLKAAIGASRAAVDAGFVPNDYQVGQTGKVVAPELYIAIGISGAIQHLAGMKESKTIIAINKDPDAPIFQIADYGYVGDLFEVVPQITRELCGGD
jgi:electron transfer flavoprotein alpha subunit